MSSPGEASGGALAGLVRALRARGKPVADLCQGLDVTLDSLEDPSTRVGWETAAEILERLEAIAGDRDAFVSLSGEIAQHSLAARPRHLGRIAVTLEQLYRLFVGDVAPSQFPVHDGVLEPLGRERFRIRLSIPENRAGSEALFRVFHGIMVTLPRLHGLHDAGVESKIGPYAAEYLVTLPTGGASDAGDRVGSRLVEVADAAVEEITRRRGELRASQRALREARDEALRRQEELAAEFEQGRRAQRERQRLEEHLRKAEVSGVLGELAAGIVHEFNNHLVAVSWSLELLKPLVRGNREAEELLATLEQAVVHERVLTSQLDTFGRRGVVGPEPVDVNRAIEALREFLKRLTTDIQVETILKRPLGRVLVDPSEFQLVLMSLVSNAREASGEGGVVEIRTEGVDVQLEGSGSRPHVRVCVADEGPGMDGATLSRIFEPGYDSLERKRGGLSLSTVRAILEASGGRSWAESEPGRGSRFYCDLPVVGEGAQSEDD